MNYTVHDLYFTETNYNYIYNLLNKLLIEDTNTNIINNTEFKEIYRINYPKYFFNTDTDDISYINKLLIDDIGKIFLSKISNDKIIKYDILKYKTVTIDSDNYICIKINENINIKNDIYINFYNNDEYINSIKCYKNIKNYILILSNNYNSKSNKVRI